MSTTHETYGDDSSRIVRTLGMTLATLAAFAVGGGLMRYGLSEVWASAHQQNVLEWLRYSFADGHDAAGVARYWSMLAASPYPFYLVALAFGSVMLGGMVLAVLLGLALERAAMGLLVMSLIGGVAALVGAPLLDHVPMVQVWLAPGAVFLGGLLGLLGAPAEDGPRVVRGARTGLRRTSAKQLARASRKAHRQGAVLFGGVALPRPAETRHAVVLGATGTGKSVAIREVLAGLIARGDRAMVADPDGSAMATFWRDGDVLLNPEDARSVRWDVFGELERDADTKRFAEALMPSPGDAESLKWVEDGRAVLAATMRAFHREGLGSQADLALTLGGRDTERLAMLTEGTPAERFFAEGNERMLGSVLSTLRRPAETLLLSAQGTGPAFSVRRWVREGRGRLWLPYRADQVPLLRDAFACLLSVAMVEALSLPEDHARRLWFVIDEADQLGRITDLELVLTKGRKKGACVVLGFQSIAQLQQHYGRAVADVINEQCGNRLILRCDTSEGGGTARFASELIGDREVEREEETRSSTRGDKSRSSSRSQATRRSIERAVLPAEIAALPDCEGYLRIATQPAWTRVGFVPVRRESRMAGFVARREEAPMRAVVGTDAEELAA